MRPVLAWVLGKGGLIGSHLGRALSGRLSDVDSWEAPVPRLCWSDRSVLPAQLTRAVAAFAEAVRAGYRKWLVLWAAGCGVVASRQEAMKAETDTWCLLLDLLGRELLDCLRPIPGTVFLASSAGGVFGKGANEILTENAVCGPVSEYGVYQVMQEQVIRDWAGSRPGVGFVIGRLANVYGAGQNLAKPQGLISHLSRCLICRLPARIYVPLDTIRDYIFVEDCADLIIQCLERALALGADCRTVKLIVSERPASVAQILGTFSRLFHRHPRIICSPSLQAAQQPRKLQFRSSVWPDIQPLRRTALAVGIRQVHEHQLVLFNRGQLLPRATPRREVA